MNSIVCLRRVPLIALLLAGLAPCCASPPRAESDAEKKSQIESMYAEFQPEFRDVPEVDASELARWLEDREVVLVDVRTPEERNVSRLPGSISKEEFEAVRDELSDRIVVAHCTIGYRSGVYAAELMEAGFDVYNLRGSILAWAHADKPFVDSEGRPTRRVHTYGARWNLLPNGYEAVY